MTGLKAEPGWRRAWVDAVELAALEVVAAHQRQDVARSHLEARAARPATIGSWWSVSRSASCRLALGRRPPGSTQEAGHVAHAEDARRSISPAAGARRVGSRAPRRRPRGGPAPRRPARRPTRASFASASTAVTTPTQGPSAGSVLRRARAGCRRRAPPAAARWLDGELARAAAPRPRAPPAPAAQAVLLREPLELGRDLRLGHAAQRAAVALALVERLQAVLHGGHRRPLQIEVERRLDAQAALRAPPRRRAASKR